MMPALFRKIKATRAIFKGSHLAKPTLMFLLTISLLLIPTLLASCKNNTERENTMIQNTTIPVIDVNAPTKTETATFALG
jgi:hypothetical protein